MADNRQFADHAEIGGVNTYFEDKKLAESPSQTDVESTDYFVLKDTDGVPHKIVKSDVLEMVRDAMGTILANNNKGTSVAKVPTIGSSGNDLGSSSVADLASVLGGNGIADRGKLFKINGVATGTTVDANLLTSGVYYAYGGALNLPSSYSMIICISENSNTSNLGDVSQLAFGMATGKIYFRTRVSANWSQWKEIATV